MSTQSLEVPLKGFGASPTQAQLVVENLTTGQRVRRAGVALAAGGALAVIALPIPLVHFVLVPGRVAPGSDLRRNAAQSAAGNPLGGRRLPLLRRPSAAGPGRPGFPLAPGSVL